MFAARGLVLCFAVFVLLYASLSFLVAGAWRFVGRHRRRVSAQACSGLLFALRISPLVVSAFVTLVLMVPSFLLLEPHSIDESIGVLPVALDFCCLILLGAGALKATKAQVRTSRVVADWLSEATVVTSSTAVPVLRVPGVMPALAAAGIRRPKVVMSDAAAVVLTEAELQTALRHELAHVRRRDNLKKLLFRFCAFPGMGELEYAWSQAAEMAADDAAVSSSSEALDLASALIKLSRFAVVSMSAEIATALVSANAASVNARVERLIAWRAGAPPKQLFSLWYALATALGVCLAMNYSAVLAQIHVASERLVR